MRFKDLLLKSIFWRICFLASGFLLNIILSRLLQADISGGLYYLMSLYSFIIIVIVVGLDSSLAYHFVKQAISGRQAFLIALLWAIAASALSYIPLKYYVYNSAGSLFTFMGFIVYSLAFIFGSLLLCFFQPLFFAVGNYKIPNMLLGLLNFIVGAILIVLFFLLPKQIFIAVAIKVYLSSFLVAGVVMMLLFFLKEGHRKAIVEVGAKHAVLKSVLRYSAQALIANTIAFLLYRIDFWYVEKYCTASDLGNYAQVTKIAMLFLLFPKMTSSAIFQTTAHEAFEKNRQRLQQISRLLVFFILPIFMIVALCGYWLFPLVYGKTFSNMYLPFVLMMPGIFSLCILIPFSSYFAGKNLVSVNIWGSVIALVLLILLCYFLVPVFGILGAAVSCSISYTACLFFELWFFYKKGSVTVKDLLLLKKSDLAIMKDNEFFKNILR